jgi:hypothetical protein
MPKPLVAYLRVSTREQGRSGLGIEAQRAAIARFAEAEGFAGGLRGFAQGALCAVMRFVLPKPAGRCPRSW